jgi:hypothetical protein
LVGALVGASPRAGASIRAGRSVEFGTRLVSRPLSADGSIRGSISRSGRAGRVTAPVGRVSTDPAAPPVGTWNPGRSASPSRPFRIRVRRSSLSSRTPGVLAAAPVGLSLSSLGGATLAGRATVKRSLRSPACPLAPLSPAAYAGLIGRSVRNGSAFTARRASTSSAARVLVPSAPKSFAGRAVTAR